MRIIEASKRLCLVCRQSFISEDSSADVCKLCVAKLKRQQAFACKMSQKIAGGQDNG
jgi:hypothetical protein